MPHMYPIRPRFHFQDGVRAACALAAYCWLRIVGCVLLAANCWPLERVTPTTDLAQTWQNMMKVTAQG